MDWTANLQLGRCCRSVLASTVSAVVSCAVLLCDVRVRAALPAPPCAALPAPSPPCSLTRSFVRSFVRSVGRSVWRRLGDDEAVVPRVRAHLPLTRARDFSARLGGRAEHVVYAVYGVSSGGLWSTCTMLLAGMVTVCRHHAMVACQHRHQCDSLTGVACYPAKRVCLHVCLSVCVV